MYGSLPLHHWFVLSCVWLRILHILISVWTMIPTSLAQSLPNLSSDRWYTLSTLGTVYSLTLMTEVDRDKVCFTSDFSLSWFDSISLSFNWTVIVYFGFMISDLIHWTFILPSNLLISSSKHWLAVYLGRTILVGSGIGLISKYLKSFDRKTWILITDRKLVNLLSSFLRYSL